MTKYIVLGGGILGASAAYHLAKNGADVTLIDKKHKGQATDAGAGIICPWLSKRRNKAWYRLVKEGAKFYPGLIDELEDMGETETGYARVGAVSLHDDEKKLLETEKRAREKKSDAPEMGDITRLSREETKALIPPLKEDFAGIHVTGGARVNGRAVRDALIRSAEKLGAKLVNGEAKLITGQHGVAGAEVDGELYQSDKYIIAGGAWAPSLFKPLGLNLLVKPQRGQIVHLKTKGYGNHQWPVMIPPGDYYMLDFGNGHMAVGATREDDTGFDYRVTVSGLYDVLSEALKAAPGLADCEVIETRTGFRPFTPSSLPVLGNVPLYENVYMANGLGATGLTSGPYLGAVLAELAMDHRIELDLSDYNVTEAFDPE